MLTAGAALVGLGVALIALQLVALYGADYIPRIDEVRFSATTFAWLAGLAVASGIVIGIVPAWYGSAAARRPGAAYRRAIVDRWADASPRPAGVGRRGIRPGHAAARGRRAGPGQPRSADPRAGGHRHDAPADGIGVTAARRAIRRTADREAFWKRAVDRLAALPGVQSVALSDSRPPSESGQRNNFDLEDRPTPAGQNQPICTWVGVSPGFFKSAGVSARARPPARRAVAAGGRRRRRSRLGHAVLPRRGDPRPSLPQRRMHHLPVDDGGRRGQ